MYMQTPSVDIGQARKTAQPGAGSKGPADRRRRRSPLRTGPDRTAGRPRPAQASRRSVCFASADSPN
jgi:hypothetical protein